MNKKKNQVYRAAITFYLVLFIIAVLWGAYVIISFNYAFWGGLVVEVIGGISGFMGFGSIVNPDKIGKFAVGLFGKLLKNYEDSEAANGQTQTQTQTKSSGNQVNINGSKNVIHVDSDKLQTEKSQEAKETSGASAKVFSCPNGHPVNVYPPDDNHPTASREKEHAQQNAYSTVIPITCRCRYCGQEVTLYWYMQSYGSSRL